MSHSYTQTILHVVFSTKDRANSIRPNLQPKLSAYLAGICQHEHIFVHAIGAATDHLHCLLQLPATLSVAKVRPLPASYGIRHALSFQCNLIMSFPMEGNMTRFQLQFLIALFALSLFGSSIRAQTPEIKFIADTLVIQAEGSYQADPDLATVVFEISAQDKDLKSTYDRASASMQKIINLAEKNGLQKIDISSGVLTVRPYYEGDRKKKAKSYSVTGESLSASTISPSSAPSSKIPSKTVLPIFAHSPARSPMKKPPNKKLLPKP